MHARERRCRSDNQTSREGVRLWLLVAASCNEPAGCLRGRGSPMALAPQSGAVTRRTPSKRTSAGSSDPCTARNQGSGVVVNHWLRNRVATNHLTAHVWSNHAKVGVMTDFYAKDDRQVGSRSDIDVDLGVGGRRLIVTSGIVLLGWQYDSDETWRGHETVWLDVFAHDLEQWSAFVGLASIANDESGFVFAVDSATVRMDAASGELILEINDALMGESSSLNRISYQVVATVVRTTTGISGKISWPTALWKPGSSDPGEAQQQLTVVANRYEVVKPPGGFAYTKLTPIAPGLIESLQVTETQCVATYRIPNPPMGVDLQVTVTAGADFHAPAGVGVGQVSGPTTFVLSPAQPNAQADFAVGALEGVR